MALLGGVTGPSDTAARQKAGEGILAAATAARKPDNKDKAVDVTRGWQLSEKELCEDGMRKLLALATALAMNTSLACKVIAGIVIFRFMMAADCALRTAVKEATTQLHEAKAEMSKEERRECPQPFIVAGEALVQAAADMASAKLESSSNVLQRITAYASALDMMAEDEKAETLLQDFRYVRQRSTWEKGSAILEIGLGPLASDSARSFFKALRQFIVAEKLGRELTGIAPMTAIERRIASVLKDLKVWK